MIRVFIVHEMPLMTNIVSSALEDEPDIKITGCATTVEEAIENIEQNDIDVILASSHLPDQGSIRLIHKMNEIDPSLDLVVVGVTETKERVLHYVEAGASGYVTRDSTIEDMVSSIRLAQQDKAVAPPEITAALMDRLSEYAQLFSDLEMGVIESAGLTERELEVLALLGKNMTNKEIADELFIEVGTVKNHVHNILNKLNVTSRSEAATYLALIRK
jgi:two-component system NarL family response regulator